MGRCFSGDSAVERLPQVRTDAKMTDRELGLAVP